jgi:PAS domain S-box-containing protein
VDDHPTNITLLQAQLEAEGYQVLCASNGVEALELLNRHAVDCIISDILMPRMDGYRLCMEVRKSQSLATLPFVLYTSTYNSPADRKLAQAAGADAIVEKPAPINTLLAGLQSASRQPRPSSPPTALPELEAPVLKQYNETLIRKLEQKSAELGAAYDGLAQSEARLSGMVEAALDAIITADEDQKIILFNGAAEKMFGCSRGQALSSSLREFFPESLRAMLGEQIELFTASSQIGPRVGLRTVRGRRAGGMEFPVEASISRLETSRGPLYTLFLRDVTDRYRAEQALARSESALRMAQELANLAHVTTGPDGSFENCSDTFASLIGLSPQLAPQSIRAWLLLVHPDDRRLLLRSVVRAARTGLRTVTQYRLQHDTVTHHIHHVMDPLPAPSNARARHTRWFHTLQDISESKR